jgi:hypothetical protein
MVMVLMVMVLMVMAFADSGCAYGAAMVFGYGAYCYGVCCLWCCYGVCIDIFFFFFKIDY